MILRLAANFQNWQRKNDPLPVEHALAPMTKKSTAYSTEIHGNFFNETWYQFSYFPFVSATTSSTNFPSISTSTTTKPTKTTSTAKQSCCENGGLEEQLAANKTRKCRKNVCHLYAKQQGACVPLSCEGTCECKLPLLWNGTMCVATNDCPCFDSKTNSTRDVSIFFSVIFYMRLCFFYQNFLFA